MSRKRRKVVFVIVEGPSDETALEHSFEAFFNPDEVMIKVVHGDMTTKIGATSSNIIASVYNLMKDCAKKYGLKPSDFLRVIHIVDTDGAYIPDALVIEDESHKGPPLYDEKNIVASPKSKISERNAQKRANLDKLASTPTVWVKIPYSIYYMSCNLDHVLYGVQNSTDADKRQNAFQFATKYKDDLAGFMKFISNPSIAVAGNHKETWEYIRQGLNSLHRHTNLHLCFQSQ